MSVLLTFQDAKDTFYVTLRDRLAALNPDRTVVVRGAARPAVVVEENEIAGDAGSGAAPAGPFVTGAFVLRWSGFAADASCGAVPLERGTCEIRYATAGLPEMAGTDRGRTLTAMDEELLAMLRPGDAPLQSFGGVAPATGWARVFWSDASFSAATVTADRVAHVATVTVFAWKEAL